MPPLDQTRDPGRVADIIASYLALPIGDKQSLLATVDPVARLTRVEALMDLSALSVSPTLEATKRRALDSANQRKHEYATLEHLLLALIDDADAVTVLQARKADLRALKASLLNYLDNELQKLVIENGADAKPTPAFERVSHRAAHHAQRSDQFVVTGVNMLLANFHETRSPAVRFLSEQGLSPERMSDLIGKGI